MQTLFLTEFLQGANGFFLHFLTSIAFTLVFAVIYLKTTPYDEFNLIKAGKTAPAIAFSGALLGFVLALASAVINSISYQDMAVWAGLSLLVQVGVFVLMRAGFSDLCRRITDDEWGAGLLLGVISLAAGILNAACMSY